MRQKNIIRKTLTALWIVEEKTELDAFKRAEIKYRFNPYNPLTYICILTLLLSILLASGIGGLKELISSDEIRFKWRRL